MRPTSLQAGATWDDVTFKFMPNLWNSAWARVLAASRHVCNRTGLKLRESSLARKPRCVLSMCSESEQTSLIRQEAYLGVLLDEYCVWPNLEQPLLKGLICSCTRDPIWYHCHHCRACSKLRMTGVWFTRDVNPPCAALAGSGMLPKPLVLTKQWRFPGHLLQHL